MYEPEIYMSVVDNYMKLNRDIAQKNIKLNSIQLQLIMSDLNNKILYKYSKDQLCMFKRINQIVTKKSDTIIFYNNGTSKFLNIEDSQMKPSFSTMFWKCWAGLEYIEVDLNGNLYSCVKNSESFFNINQNLKILELPSKPQICKNKYCYISCWPIRKEKLLK